MAGPYAIISRNLPMGSVPYPFQEVVRDQKTRPQNVCHTHFYIPHVISGNIELKFQFGFGFEFNFNQVPDT